MTSFTRNPHPQTKKFFFKSRPRLAASFEPLNSSLPFSAPELRTCKAMCDPVVLAWESPIPTGHQSVEKHIYHLQCHVTHNKNTRCVHAKCFWSQPNLDYYIHTDQVLAGLLLEINLPWSTIFSEWVDKHNWQENISKLQKLYYNLVKQIDKVDSPLNLNA